MSRKRYLTTSSLELLDSRNNGFQEAFFFNAYGRKSDYLPKIIPRDEKLLSLFCPYFLIDKVIATLC